MPVIEQTPPPAGSLLADYAARPGHYTDCFVTPAPQGATLGAYIRAFYTQPLFRAERAVLRLLAGAPSSDADVAALAAGQGTQLAVWTVADRRAGEIVLADRTGRTLSWLSVEGGLHFGSVVVPVEDRRGRLTLGPVFQSLKGAHLVYSRALLAGAARRMR